MSKARTNPDFLNGVPELLILKLLSTRPMHGYELVQAIRRSTGEVLHFGEGCIYPILHRLEREKLLASSQELVRGRSRVVYRVTPQGKQSLAESAAQWTRIAEAVGLILQGCHHVKPAFA